MFNKVANRIFIGYSVPLILLIVLGIEVSSVGQKIFDLETEVFTLQSIAKKAGDVSYDVSRLLRTLRGVAIFPKDQRYREDYNTASESFNKNVKELEEETTDQYKELANTLITQGKQIQNTSGEFFRLIEANNLTAAAQSVDSSKARTVEEVRQQFNQQIEDAVSQRRQKLEEARSFLHTIVLITNGLAILSTIVVGLWISMPLRRRLPKVVEAAEGISRGDLTHTVEVTNDRTEVGQLLVAFQQMAKQLNSLISQVQKSGIQITTSTIHIAAAGKQLEATVIEQLASTNQVSATSQEIAATSGQLVKTMEHTTQMAQVTANAAGNSQTNLMQMATAMQQLAVATTSISSTLEVMNEKANNISSVVTTITKVADQTNLLSLNAAIEAEKAGEYGAGFAVVAREIRRLADQTAVATLEIEQMVKEMQSSVATGVTKMNKFNKEVSSYVEQVGQISEQVAQVSEKVQGLTPRFEEVSHSMEEQFEGAQQISTAIAQLSEASHQTVASLQEINKALEQLDDAAQGLQGIIALFKVQS